MNTLKAAALTALMCACSLAAGARADVQVLTGPTPIPAGSARSPGDITVVNDKLAFALAVHSAVPYGVPRGALVDIAPVAGGRIQRDRVVFADFIPNNWSAWPNTYQHVEVLERGPRRARIRTVRDWGRVTLTTLYTLAAGSDQVAISVTMTNGGGTALPGLLSGLTLWPSGGFLFPVPGSVPATALAGPGAGRAAHVLSPRVVAYDADWAVTLHAPYLDHVGSRSRDLLLLHTLGPHASRTFSGWLQVGASADLAPVVAAEIERRHLPSGRVHGALTGADARALDEPVVVVQQDDKPYAWTLARDGHYALRLPAGEYTLYGTARNYARSRAARVSVAAGSDQARDFRDLKGPGRIAFSVADAARGAPLDARIAIGAGETPLVGFLGRRTFFTELANRGHLEVPMAPGRYRFTVSYGRGFLARDTELAVNVSSGRLTRVSAQIVRLFAPPLEGWYAADLHHHADQAEAVTPPADLARSQLAAGLDLLFVSDHDSNVNHAALRAMAARRGVPFIPGIELSPSWGHFNAYPIDPGARLAIDTSTADVAAIFREARREGAAVIQVNHPFIPYGYFASVKAGVAPGGLDPDFDLIEVNSTEAQDDDKVIAEAWRLWNDGKRYYLAAGSDTHDVWNGQSGRVRTFVHVRGPLTVPGFIAALKAGCAYVSYGPLVFPRQPCGTIQLGADRTATLGFELGAVAGLKKAELIGGGTIVDTRTFTSAPLRADVQFRIGEARPAGAERPRVVARVPAGVSGAPRWYALMVEDRAGHKAYTDPYWIAPGE